MEIATKEITSTPSTERKDAEVTSGARVREGDDEKPKREGE